MKFSENKKVYEQVQLLLSLAFFLQVQTTLTNWSLIVGMGAYGFKGMSDENETDSPKYKFLKQNIFHIHCARNKFQLSLQRKKELKSRQTHISIYLFTNWFLPHLHIIFFHAMMPQKQIKSSFWIEIWIWTIQVNNGTVSYKTEQ